MKRTGWLISTLIISFAVQAIGQTTLTQVFRDLHSTDPKIREYANSIILQTAEQQLPVISTETLTICTALGDSDPYIRQQASGILSVLVQLHPEDVAVVSACTKQLIDTAMDPTPKVRQNSLFVLAMKSDGPPSEAAHDFEAAIDDTNITYKQLGALGVMKLPDASSASKKHLAQSMLVLSDANAKQALLMGAVQSHQIDSDVAASVTSLLSDKSPAVQYAAVLALEGSSPSKSAALNTLQNYRQSGSLSPYAKQAADAAIQRLQASTSVR